MVESDFGVPDSLKDAIALAIAISYLASLFAYQYGSPGNIGGYLSALIRAESGIIAITFSVLFLGVQIASSKYTSRLSKSYFSDRLVQSTVILLAIATAMDLILLYNLPEQAGQSYISLIFVSSGLSIVAFYSLYLSVNRIFIRTTPEGIIRTSSAHLRPSTMETFADDPERTDHPTRDLFDLVNASIEEGERLDSKESFKTYIEDITDIAEYHQTESHDIDTNLYGKMYDTIFLNQLPELFIQSTGQDLREVRTPVAMCHRQLAQIVYDVYPGIAEECIQGFLLMLTELNSKDNPRTTVDSSIQIVGEQIMGFVYYLIVRKDRERLPVVLNQLTEFLLQQPELIRPLSSVLLRYLPSLERKISEEITDSNDLDFSKISLPGETINDSLWDGANQSNKEAPIILTYQLHILISRSICQGDCVKPELCESWEASFRLSNRTPNSTFQDDIVRTILELSQISEEADKPGSHWTKTVAQCRMVNNRTVSQSIDNWMEDIENNRTTGFYRSISDTADPFSITNYSTSRSYQEIGKSVREIQSESLRHYRTLRWGTEEIEKFRDTIFDNLDELFEEPLLFVKGTGKHPASGVDPIFTSGYNLVGPDSIFAYNFHHEPIFVKVVRSLGENDFEEMLQFAQDIYDEISYDEYPTHGPHRFQFVIAAPDITDVVKSKFDCGPLRVVSIDSDTYPNIDVTIQMRLTDFVHTPPPVRSSGMVTDSLEIGIQSDY